MAHRAAVMLSVAGKTKVRLEGDWLWTHFGASGPLALNLSRHWHRAALDGAGPEIAISLCPGESFESIENWLIEQAGVRPRAQLSTVLATRLPASVCAAWLRLTAIAGDTALAHLAREDRRRLVHALTAHPLHVRDSRGYQYAEVTAGGIPLSEINPSTLESRVCPGLYLVGEILDVDGRLGGFNFQWAWSSGFVAGTAVARALTRETD